jgi:general secretion pathway protein A
MYEQFFGLTDKPFSITPNPRFVFYSKQYREAEGQLLYGINNREGFMVVTGQPGTGKTTLCRDLIEKLDHEKSQSALIFNPFLNGVEMLAALLMEFGVSVPPNASRKELLDRLNQFLLAQLALGKSCVAIFDEAQHLSAEFLEQIRVLSNLETDQEKLIQIVLVGQPELLDKLRAPSMSQLDQRVSIRCMLTDLDEQETDRYIHHRLNVAGARGQVRVSPKAVTDIHRGSHGVPRLINLICDRALLAGYAAQTRDIQPIHVRKAVAALRGEDAEVRANAASAGSRSWRRRAAMVAGGIAVAAGITAGVAFWPRQTRSSPDDALYWRASTQASATDAERDLAGLIAGYPNSRHLDDALLRLAQLELSRGDRVAALDYLARLGQHAPAGIYQTRATVLSATAQLDNGDSTSACQALTPDLGRAANTDSSLAREFDAVSKTCVARAASASAATAVDSNAVHARHDSTATPTNKPAGAATVAAPVAASDTARPSRAKPATPHALSSTKP